MARELNALFALLALHVAGPALGACIFDANDEITNPVEPGCGDVVFTYTEADNAGNHIALGFPAPAPVASLTPVEGFRDYASLFARHQSLLALHDEVAGQIVGTTIGGREIWAYAIGDPDATTFEGATEPAVLVNGGIHAREWQSPEAVTAVFETLIERKQNGGLEQYLIENLTTVLLPVNNVDGLIQTQRFHDRATAAREQPREGRMRRKNMRNPVTNTIIDDDLASVNDNFWGVDLNRNFARGYAQGNRSSDSLTSLIYRGSAPQSEPEIDALINAAAMGPASRLRFFSDTHSFSQVHFAPTTGVARRNAITAALSARMRAASERVYRYAPDLQGSPGIGTAADYFAFTYQIPAWTFELEPLNGGQDYGGLATHGHSGFILPAREVPRMREDVTRMYLLGFYRQAGPPAVIAAQIREAETDAVVFDSRWNADASNARTQQISAQRALVPGRTYRLWVAFNKPMRIRDGNGAVARYRGQSAGADVGAVSLHAPSLTSSPIDLSAAAVWLNAPGGAPHGYLRYADDAFGAEFTVPATLQATQSAPAALSLEIRDLSDAALDANPETIVDWANGAWIGYENSQGAEGDLGGVDCTLKLFIAAAADAPAPDGVAECNVGFAPAPTPSPQPPAAAPRSSGGGGADLLLLALLAALFASDQVTKALGDSSERTRRAVRGTGAKRL